MRAGSACWSGSRRVRCPTACALSEESDNDCRSGEDPRSEHKPPRSTHKPLRALLRCPRTLLSEPREALASFLGGVRVLLLETRVEYRLCDLAGWASGFGVQAGPFGQLDKRHRPKLALERLGHTADFDS